MTNTKRLIIAATVLALANLTHSQSNLEFFVASLQTNSLTGGSLLFTDPQATNYPRRYYQAVLR